MKYDYQILDWKQFRSHVKKKSTWKMNPKSGLTGKKLAGINIFLISWIVTEKLRNT